MSYTVPSARTVRVDIGETDQTARYQCIDADTNRRQVRASYPSNFETTAAWRSSIPTERQIT